MLSDATVTLAMSEAALPTASASSLPSSDASAASPSRTRSVSAAEAPGTSRAGNADALNAAARIRATACSSGRAGSRHPDGSGVPLFFTRRRET